RRPHVAGLGLEWHESRFERLHLTVCRATTRQPRLALLVDRLQRLGDGRLGRNLHRHVDRRKHAQAALIDALPTEALDELTADLFFEVLAVRLLGAKAIAQRDARRARRLPG